MFFKSKLMTLFHFLFNIFMFVVIYLIKELLMSKCCNAVFYTFKAVRWRRFCDVCSGLDLNKILRVYRFITYINNLFTSEHKMWVCVQFVHFTTDNTMLREVCNSPTTLYFLTRTTTRTTRTTRTPRTPRTPRTEPTMIQTSVFFSAPEGSSDRRWRGAGFH